MACAWIRSQLAQLSKECSMKNGNVQRPAAEPEGSANALPFSASRRRLLGAAACGFGGALLALPARARSALAVVPSAGGGAPVRLVIPFSAGATSDLLARPIMRALEPLLGAPIVIDNRPGAGGMIGAAEVVRARPDGQTLAWGTVSNHAIAPALYPQPAYDPLRDFTPIALLLAVPHVITLHPSVPARSLPELIALLRRNPGRFDYASSGNGTLSHLIAEQFKARTGTFITHIPYRSSAQGLPDFLAGRVALMFDTVVVSRQPVTNGQAHALAVTSGYRTSVLPEVPTLKEYGLDDLEATGWFGVYGPPDLPAAQVQRLNAALNQVLADPSVRKTLTELGAQVLGGSAADFAAHNRREVHRWGALVRRLGARPD
jgi:tripartite-type tricarboxylate transporter receptor subunit TctC